MKVKVQYLGSIRVLVNKREEEIDLSLKATINELFMKLSNEYGEAFKKEVFEDGGNFREGVIVTVNGIAVGQLKGLETKLKIGDAVSLLPLFAGGG